MFQKYHLFMFFGEAISTDIHMVLYWTHNCMNRKNTVMSIQAGLITFKVSNKSADY
jgi:hypothetical protein